MRVPIKSCREIDQCPLEETFGGTDIIRELSGEFEAVRIDFAAKIAETGVDVLDIDGIHLSREGHEMLLRLLLPQIS